MSQSSRPFLFSSLTAYDHINTYFQNSQQKDDEIVNFYWPPLKEITDSLVRKFDLQQPNLKILDVGGSLGCKFSVATHIIDIAKPKAPTDIVVDNLDLDWDVFPYENNYFDFIYSRHTMEDLLCPFFALKEMFRCCKTGYIETPSPIAELSKVNTGTNIFHKGYVHHNFFCWCELEDNSIHFLPKYSIIEYLNFQYDADKSMNYILNNFPVYWNNYYIWDENHPPKFVIHKNGVNFDLAKDDYQFLLMRALHNNIKYTTWFIKDFLQFC